MYRLILVLLLCSCHKKQTSHATPSYPVKITEVKTKDTPIFIEALGHVQSITSINIYSRIGGELTGIHFVQGKEVKRFLVNSTTNEIRISTDDLAAGSYLCNLQTSAGPIGTKKMIKLR